MTKIRVSKIGKSILLFGILLYAAGLMIFLILRLLFADRFWWLAFLNNFAPYYFLPLVIVAPLALLLRSRRVLLGLLPFVLIAAFWFGPRFMPKAIAHTQGTPLSIVTFNMRGGNATPDAVEQWLRKADTDLVFLQEILPLFSTNGIPQLRDRYPYQFAQTVDERTYGNMILSKIPFVEAKNVDMEGDGTPSHQRIVLTIGGKQIALYNIHFMLPIRDDMNPRVRLPFDNPFLNLLTHYDDALRNGEIIELLNQIRAEKLPYVVAGDFNMGDYSVVYGDLAAQMHDTQQEILSFHHSSGGSTGIPRTSPDLGT